MPLQARMIAVPLAQGVSTKQDPKQVPLGKLLTLENGFFQTPGEIRKRYGFTAKGQSILGGGTLDSCNGQFAYNNELLQSSPSNATTARGGRMYNYDASGDAWGSIGAFYGMQLTTAPVSSGEIAQLHPDGSYDPATGLRCFTWIDDSNIGLYVSVVDAATGKTIYTANLATLQDRSRAIKVIYFSGNFFVMYFDNPGAVNTLAYYRIATSNPTAVASSGTIATAGSTNFFDALVLGSRLYITYGAISILYMDTSYVLSAVTTSAGGAGTAQSLSICSESSTRLGVALGTSITGYAAVFDQNLGVILATGTLGASSDCDQIGICSLGNVYHVYTSKLSVGLTRYARFTNSAVTTNLTTLVREVSLAGKPFVYNGNIFFFGAPNAPYQETLCLYTHYSDCDDTNPCAVVGKVAYSNYGNLAYGVFRVLPTPVQISAGVYQLAYPQSNGILRVDVGNSASYPPSATWALTIDFTKATQGVQIAQGLHLTGGQLWLYDGLNITEHGFHFWPNVVSATDTGAGGSIADGTYSYVAVYEWIDGAGQVHRSAPTQFPVSVTTSGGSSTVSVVVRTLTTTNKRGIATTGTVRPTNKVKVCIYRTLASGTVYYFVGSVDNDITASTVAYSDTSADATILLNLQLYTTGGQVDNTGAPACSTITAYKSRLVLVPSDNPYSWWFSQEIIPDSEATLSTPVEMSDLFIQNINEAGGPITGLGVIDDKLVLMKGQTPYYIVGNGPAPNGSNNDYSPPQIIAAPVGAVSAISMVGTPMGLMFQAPNDAGIWLLDRSLNVSYVGADVEAYNAQDVTSAVLYPQYNQVRFSMSGGVCLVFDYFVQQWTVSTNIAAVQACIWQGSYTYVRSTALALQESTATFTDNGTFVQLKIGTSWLQLAGLQGFQRIYEALILGDYQSAHSLVAKVYYDFDPTVAQTTTIVPTSTPPYEWRLLLKRQKCEAMKLELYDTQVSPAEGMRLSAITLWVGVKYGLNKMGASRTFD